MTTSIGVSVYPEDGEDADTLLKNVDVAMYQAKHLGRNAYQYFAGEMNNTAVERLRLENDLRNAMARRQLSLHYQIRIDVRDGGIAGVEALMRWQHPQLGMVPPVTFIPIAEEQARLLARQGCYIMQGYFFSEAMPAETLTQTLEQGSAFNQRILESLGNT